MVQPITSKAKINAISTLSNLIAELPLCTTWQVTHVTRDKRSMCARDLHTIAPGPLERTCWRQFTGQ